MLGDFLIRILVLFLGYAYPAFECYKTVEKNRVEIDELRFWCQYWIILAMMTVLERVGDIFVSWLPMYGEMKLALIIYLWYPKTKGTGYVYETFLRPYVARHETEIERNIEGLKVRALDLAFKCWENCTEIGQTSVSQLLQYIASHSAKMRSTNTISEGANQEGRWPPISPPLQQPTTSNRSVAPTPNSNAVQFNLRNQTERIHIEEEELESVSGPGSTHGSDGGLDSSLHAARLRLRRSQGFH